MARNVRKLLRYALTRWSMKARTLAITLVLLIGVPVFNALHMFSRDFNNSASKLLEMLTTKMMKTLHLGDPSSDLCCVDGCQPGFRAIRRGSRTFCVDIDECRELSRPCPSSYVCLNKPGGHVCLPLTNRSFPHLDHKKVPRRHETPLRRHKNIQHLSTPSQNSPSVNDKNEEDFLGLLHQLISLLQVRRKHVPPPPKSIFAITTLSPFRPRHKILRSINRSRQSQPPLNNAILYTETDLLQTESILDQALKYIAHNKKGREKFKEEIKHIYDTFLLEDVLKMLQNLQNATEEPHAARGVEVKREKSSSTSEDPITTITSFFLNPTDEELLKLRYVSSESGGGNNVEYEEDDEEEDSSASRPSFGLAAISTALAWILIL